MQHWLHRFRSIAPLLLAGTAALLFGCSEASRISVSVPWSITGEWLVADTHSHTTFSDGSLSVSQLVERAIVGGCDVLAITDHSDESEQAATPEYFEAVRVAREETPWLILFAGLEWNIPPFGGREHVNILLDPSQEEILGRFKDRFEGKGGSAEDAIHWLANSVEASEDLVFFYNHPSRKDENATENAADIQRWRQASTRFVGFEGGPGHQKAPIPGDYRRMFSTIDRWDPVVNKIGGTWDQLLDQGEDVWAALAVSDFHNDHLDENPCAFARTRVQVPERSAGGVLESLAAGSFWADHGHILEELSFMLWVADLGRPVFPGETVEVADGERVTVSLSVAPGPGLDGTPLTVELVGNGRSGKPAVLESRELAQGETMVQWAFPDLRPGADGKSAYFRVIVRAPESDDRDLRAVSNPIRAILL